MSLFDDDNEIGMGIGDMIGAMLMAGNGRSFDEMPESMQRKIVSDTRKAYASASPKEQEKMAQEMPKDLRKKIGIRMSIIQKQPSHINVEMELSGKNTQIVGLEDSVKGLSRYAEKAVKVNKKLKKKNKKLQKTVDEQSETMGELQRTLENQQDTITNKDDFIRARSRDLQDARNRCGALEGSIDDAIRKLQAMKDLNKKELLIEMDKLIQNLEDTKLLPEDESAQKEQGTSSGHDC